jgi:hypothetical protein
MCVLLELMFLSFYCNYIVDEIAVFYISSKKLSKIVNFRRRCLAVENKPLFSAARCQSPKIMACFRLIFSGGQRPPKIGLKPLKIAYFRRQRPYFLRPPYFRQPLAAKSDCAYCSDRPGWDSTVAAIFTTHRRTIRGSTVWVPVGRGVELNLYPG